MKKLTEKERLKKERIKYRALVRKEKKRKSIPVLSKKADILWSQVVRLKGECEYCGKQEFNQAHHVFSRNNRSVRWDLNNGVCLCSGCHTMSSIFSAHKTPSEFTYWLEGKKGREFMNHLQILAHTPLKVTSEYLEATIEEFKSILNNQ